MRVVYLGPAGTFTEKVTKKRFPNEDLVPVIPIRRIIRQVSDGTFDLGVIPFENFYDGEVRDTLDGLYSSKTNIIAELYSEIVHCLGALENRTEIKKVLSKDTALNQCYKHLEENYPMANLVPVSSTAEAVNIIGRENLHDAAAIASKKAILAGGLELLAEDICPNNRTRFAVIGKSQTTPTENDKTFLTLHPTIKDKYGVLADCLDVLRKYQINLEFIQSRPDRNKGYIFFLEIDGHFSDSNVSRALREIRDYLNPQKDSAEVLKVIGSYPNSRWKD